MYWRLFKALPKILFRIAWYKFVGILVWNRNRPMLVLIHPDPRLKRVAKPVDFDATTREDRVEIVRKMHSTLQAQTYGDKLGMAAPQIGINKRVMIVRGNVMFNPEWTPTKAPPNLITEGCYSVPGRTFSIPRAPYGWAKWTNIDGKPFSGKLKDLPAIVFQHELDHLDGKCCVDVGNEIHK